MTTKAISRPSHNDSPTTAESGKSCASKRSDSKPLSDSQVSDTLRRIRKAVDRVARELDLPESSTADHQQPSRSADRSLQSEGGLLRTAIQRGTMLITKESSARLAAERKSASEDLAGHVGSVLRELNTVRTETKRLLDQRRQLEVYLAALKTELETLRAEKVELMALKAQVKPHAGTEAEVDLVARARAAVRGTALPTGGAAPSTGSTAPTGATAPTAAEPAPTAAPGFSPAREIDEDAFNAFLQVQEDHDKSREWFMSA